MARWRRGNGKHGENKKEEARQEPWIGRSVERAFRKSKTGQALARPSFLVKSDKGACKTRNQLSATNYMRLSNIAA